MMQTVSHVEHLFCRVQTHHPVCYCLIWNIEIISKYDFVCIYIKHTMFISKEKSLWRIAYSYLSNVLWKKYRKKTNFCTYLIYLEKKILILLPKVYLNIGITWQWEKFLVMKSTKSNQIVEVREVISLALSYFSWANY